MPLVILLGLLIFITNFYKKDLFLVGRRWQNLIEDSFGFVLKIIHSQMGREGLYFFPIVLTLFFFIFVCNLISLTPFGIALTSHIINIFLLTSSIAISIFLKGFITQESSFLKLFVPEAPLLLLLLLVPIELFSYMIRALSMAIRLSANILAGHTLVFIVSNFLLLIFSLNKLFFSITFLSFLAIFLLEFGVAFLQAYVFIVLFCIYMNDSITLLLINARVF